ncbi:mitochondrial carrier [Rhizopus microsporus var. microsporus]|uniref:Mitochondrial carrier n=2 Tax=Rhizopus microsporus TaxID=58291 RepID=A0A1X0RHK8_RHIZD|nr:putative mitochondrial 2-oxodicarboxylate carrier [Rhizopus microsporus ATCC 52813]ORE11525.1 mitochondrial carrier [Rhizopus microsporus var. microsporus]PHZ12175.1 putative mitochondrial 2-oxodicarboxylate carrier [Rhizopus microsporus ATCC 52813]
MPEAVQKPLPFGFQFLAGAIAGVSEILVMYPLDVVKTRAQLSTGTSTGIIGTMTSMIKTEGPGSLYRGILPPIMVEAPKRATKFAANEQYTTIYKKLFGFEKITQTLSIMTGVSAGMTEAVIIVPFELVKVRMQDKANLGKYNGTADTIRKIVAAEGTLALFNGLEATMWRHAVWNGAYFGLIFKVKDLMPKPKDPNQQRLTNFAAGTVGGIVATAFNTPIDVVKTRIQSYNGVGVRKYNWTLPSVALVAREEGFASLYRGFLPKVLRLGPGGGILLVVFETVSNFIRKNILKE